MAYTESIENNAKNKCLVVNDTAIWPLSEKLIRIFNYALHYTKFIR